MGRRFREAAPFSPEMSGGLLSSRMSAPALTSDLTQAGLAGGAGGALAG